VLLSLLVATAVAVVILRDLFAIVMLYGIYGLLSASIFVNLDAVDVAFTEAAVSMGIATVLMLSTLALTARKEKPSRQGVLLPFLAVSITGAALIYGTLDMPYFANPNAPIHQHVAPYYIKNTLQDTGIPNMVTAILASYRGYDTLGELVVIFTAGIGVLILLGTVSRDQIKTQYSDLNMHHHIVLRVISRLLIPFILLFALYVQFHGDYGPGGGFQAGVIFAAAFILYAIIYGMNSTYRVIKPAVLRALMSAGVLLFSGTGVVTLLLGGAYLDYNELGEKSTHGQHLGIFLVELGVGISVAAVMMSIFFHFNMRRTMPSGRQ
jgi:multicomponent Na+:H+ antiporter subunit B